MFLGKHVLLFIWNVFIAFPMQAFAMALPTGDFGVIFGFLFHSAFFCIEHGLIFFIYFFLFCHDLLYTLVRDLLEYYTMYSVFYL